jgi:hypothetical protein
MARRYTRASRRRVAPQLESFIVVLFCDALN